MVGVCDCVSFWFIVRLGDLVVKWRWFKEFWWGFFGLFESLGGRLWVFWSYVGWVLISCLDFFIIECFVMKSGGLFLRVGFGVIRFIMVGFFLDRELGLMLWFLSFVWVYFLLDR